MWMRIHTIFENKDSIAVLLFLVLSLLRKWLNSLLSESCTWGKRGECKLVVGNQQFL